MKLEPADVADLRPLIEVAVRATVETIRANEARIGDRLGFDEATAANLIGVPKHVLADARRRGEVSARRVGRKIIYSRSALLQFLGGAA